MTDEATFDSPSKPDVDPSLDILINPQKIAQLKDEHDPAKRQTILDAIFTPERRQRLIQSASVDIKGRKVRYFRKMSYEKLLQLLSEGKQTHLSYFENADGHVPLDILKHLIITYGWHNGQEYIRTNEDILAEFKRVFSDVIPEAELEDVISNMTFARLIPLLDKYVPERYIKQVHTGSANQILSPYLSMSVGGVINQLRSGVYVEIVMPDSEVVAHPEGVEGEKEVLTRVIKVGDITRVYADPRTLYQDEIVNPDTPVGQTRGDSSSDNVERWRWDEKTVDYVPVALRY